MRIDATHATINLIMTRVNNVLFGPKKREKTSKRLHFLDKKFKASWHLPMSSLSLIIDRILF